MPGSEQAPHVPFRAELAAPSLQVHRHLDKPLMPPALGRGRADANVRCSRAQLCAGPFQGGQGMSAHPQPQRTFQQLLGGRCFLLGEWRDQGPHVRASTGVPTPPHTQGQGHRGIAREAKRCFRGRSAPECGLLARRPRRRSDLFVRSSTCRVPGQATGGRRPVPRTRVLGAGCVHSGGPNAQENAQRSGPSSRQWRGGLSGGCEHTRPKVTAARRPRLRHGRHSRSPALWPRVTGPGPWVCAPPRTKARPAFPPAFSCGPLLTSLKATFTPRSPTQLLSHGPWRVPTAP